jgi:hypothetical protein
MPSTSGTNRPARTLLEQLIHERNQTLEEFAAYAETFAQEHGEPGTLSAGHLQRLVAGRRYDGRPLGKLRPATARLLESIFGIDATHLLSPLEETTDNNSTRELRERLRTSSKVDLAVTFLLHEQLSSIRRLDRQLGSTATYDEVRVKIAQVKRLFSYSLSLDIRKRLSTLLAELSMLAGWQALDLRDAVGAWHHYEEARFAARESQSLSYIAHTTAQQAFVLIDINKPTEASELLGEARSLAANSTPSLTRSWLAAAHGEALAACKAESASLRAFDNAAELLQSKEPSDDGCPYVALDAVHLDRWRGHGLAATGSKNAVPVLLSSMERLDPSFTRARTALHVDLAVALNNANESEAAQKQVELARTLAKDINSKRQHHRIRQIESLY